MSVKMANKPKFPNASNANCTQENCFNLLMPVCSQFATYNMLYSVISTFIQSMSSLPRK